MSYQDPKTTKEINKILNTPGPLDRLPTEDITLTEMNRLLVGFLVTAKNGTEVEIIEVLQSHDRGFVVLQGDGILEILSDITI